MRKWCIALSMMAGLLLLPASASAGGLLSGVTDSLTGEDRESGKQEETSSLLGDTVSSVVDTVDKVTEPITETVEETVPDVKVDAGIAEVDTTEGVAVSTPVAEAKVNSEDGIEANTSVADAKLSADEGVQVDTPVAEVSVSPELEVEADTPVAEAKVSADKGVEVNTPVAEASVSPDLEIEADTPVADAKISVKNGVEVNTPVAEVNVSDNEGINLSTPVAEADISVDEDIKSETPDAPGDTVASNPDAEETNANLPDASADVKEGSEDAVKVEALVQGNIVEKETAQNNKQKEVAEKMALEQSWRPVVIDTAFVPDLKNFTEGSTLKEDADERPEVPEQGYNTTTSNQAIVTSSPSFNGGGPSQGPAGNAGGGSVPATAAVLFNQESLSEISEVSRYASERLLFDQWLNAPPTQPPKFPSFFANNI